VVKQGRLFVLRKACKLNPVINLHDFWAPVSAGGALTGKFFTLARGG
jgi:hypothetical protein